MKDAVKIVKNVVFRPILREEDLTRKKGILNERLDV
jgi:predicted Zn-dependent peptidase